MSRRLKLAVCVFLPLLAAGFAAAASVCDPGSPATTAPDAASRADALRAEERSLLLSLEDGRYEERDGFLADRREAAPERARLTNAQTARLLCPPREDKDKKEVSPAGLAALKAVPLPKAVGTLEFDGAVQRRESVEGPRAAERAGAAGAAPASEEEARLLQQVLARVKIADDPDPRAAAAIQGAMRNIITTPTGRELAEDFVAENAVSEISFDKLDGRLVPVNGRKVLSGVLGVTRSDEKKSVVALNRLFLDADPELSYREMAGTLAHELFGHCLENQRAAREHFSRSTLNRYRGDEANGRLIGWLVRTELGAPLSDGGMWRYLKDPDRFHDRLALVDTYYAQTLSAAEMRDPMPVFKKRLAKARARREDLDDDAIDMRKWRVVVEHLVAQHGMERRRFASVSEEIDNYLELERADMNKDADAVVEALQKRIEYYDTSEGRRVMRQLTDAAGSDYIRASESRLVRYRARLQFETRNRKPERMLPPLPDQIEFEELEKLYQDDLRDHPRHWGL